MRISRTATGLVAMAMLMAGCGDGDGFTVDGAWARTSPAMTSAGAVYMQLTADVDDRLVGVSVDPSIAATAEIHETVMVDMAGDDEESEGMGAMRMQEVGAIDLPAGETVSLEPGGYHIMLLDLAEPLVLGETFDVTVTFATAGTQVITIEVRDESP